MTGVAGDAARERGVGGNARERGVGGNARERGVGMMRPPALTDGKFALFADCLLIGICTAVAALGLVTAYPAIVAGCATLRERVALDHSVGPRRYWRQLRAVLRSGPAVLVAPPLVVGVLALDALAVAAGVPGRRPLAVLVVVAASLAAVLGLRVAARWRPGARWPAVARSAARELVADPGGSILLWLAAGAAATIAIFVPVTGLLLGGPLAMAAVAVDGRRVTGRLADTPARRGMAGAHPSRPPDIAKERGHASGLLHAPGQAGTAGAVPAPARDRVAGDAGGAAGCRMA